MLVCPTLSTDGISHNDMCRWSLGSCQIQTGRHRTMRRASREMTEEDEFGMNKTGSFESDPMEVESESAVKDHPDFVFLSKDTVQELLGRRDDDAQSATWLKNLPTENSDATQWTFLQVHIRPDRPWLIMQELVATICIGHGMMLAEETPSSVLFRKKVGQDTMAHGMMDAATYQNLFVSISVLPSKLRALHIGYLVSNEQKLLGGMKTSHFSSVSAERMKALNRSMDNLLAALQSTLTSQFLTSSYLYMTTPENTVEAGNSGDAIVLDDGYISDVRKMFLREMKANMRELCIPLEEYAHNQEYACALLLGLLDPLLKKYSIDLSTITGAEETEEKAAAAQAGSGSAEATATESASQDVAAEKERALSNGKMYGEIITDMAHELWTKYKRECETKVKQKIEEKQKQVSARVLGVQKLRMRALESIINHPGATPTNLKASIPGTREDVLLYEGSCVVNNVPVKLHVTYGSIVYRTLVPIFARTTVVPFSDVINVAQSTTLGIRVVNLQLSAAHARGLTIAMGLEVDLLYQLLLEIQDMRKRELANCAREASGSLSKPSPLDMHQFNAPDLETLVGAEDEEKEGEERDANDDDTDEADEEQEVTLKKLLEEEDK